MNHIHRFESILVHLDDSPAAAERLRLGRRLAQTCGAELSVLSVLSVLYAVESAAVKTQLALLENGGQIGALSEQIDADRKHIAKTQFDKVMSEPGPVASWSELGFEPLIPGFLKQALFVDLLLLGSPESEVRSQYMPEDFAASVLLGSGKPALVLPTHFDGRPFKHITVAWTPTRSSARAVEAALPFFDGAEKIEVVTWQEPPYVANTSLQLMPYLSRHGLTVALNERGTPTVSVGDDLLQLVQENGSDLLVLGCYGHSRLREWVLGGVTRSVLKHMSVPVLMAH